MKFKLIGLKRSLNFVAVRGKKPPSHQCPYLLKFVDIVLGVEVTTDLIIKLRIRRMVFTKPLVDINVKFYDKCVRMLII